MDSLIFDSGFVRKMYDRHSPISAATMAAIQPGTPSSNMMTSGITKVAIRRRENHTQAGILLMGLFYEPASNLD